MESRDVILKLNEVITKLKEINGLFPEALVADSLTVNQVNAITGAASPSASNVFATIDNVNAIRELPDYTNVAENSVLKIVSGVPTWVAPV